MRIALSQPVAASPEAVFKQLMEVDRLTDGARRPGVSIRRTDRPEPPAAGRTFWQVGLALHGVQRHGQVRLVRLEAPRAAGLVGTFDGVEAHLDLDVIGLDPQHPDGAAPCRLDLVITARAVSLRGRVLLQTLRLMEPRLRAWLAARLARQAELLAQGATD